MRLYRLLQRNVTTFRYLNVAPSLHTTPFYRSGVITRSFCASQPSTGATSARPAEVKPSVGSKEEPKAPPNDESAKVKESDVLKTSDTKPDHAVPTIPDVPSTSWSTLFFEEKDLNDPNRWKKFLWKYAGAVLLFFISYKTLHWYVAKMEADGKRRKKEIEEDRQMAKKIMSPGRSAAPQPVQGNAVQTVTSDAVVADGGGQGFAVVAPAVDSAQTDQPPEPGNDEPTRWPVSTELEALYVYKVELETRMRDLRGESKTAETDAAKREVRVELKALQKEIAHLERKRYT